MTRILCTGDWQLDSRGGLGPEWLDEQEKVCHRIAALAHDEHVDGLLLLGDVFEHRKPYPAELHAFRRILDSFPPDIPIVAIPGNGRHDGNFYGQEIALDLFDRLRVYRQPAVAELAGVSVALLPWMHEGWLVAQQDGGGSRDDVYQAAAERLIAVARGMRAQISGPALLGLHWSIEGATLPTGLSVELSREAILPLADLEEMGWDSVIAGHIHRPQVLSGGVVDLDLTGSASADGFQATARCGPVAAGARQSAAAQVEGEGVELGSSASPFPVRRPILYVGSPMPLNHGESSCEHGVWLLDTERFDATFVPIESRRFVTIEEQLSGHDQYGLEVAVSGPEVEDNIVRVRVLGTHDEARDFDLVAVKRAALAAGAWRADVDSSKLTRAATARVAAMTADLDETAALRLYLAENGIDATDRIVAAHERLLAEASA